MKFGFTKSTQSVRIPALLGILLFACGLVIWSAFDQQSTADQERILQVKTSVDGTAVEISHYLEDLNRKIAILAADHRNQIQAVLDNPLDQQEREKLETTLRKHIPELFTVTIASDKGTVLLEDYQGLINSSAHNKIKTYAKTGKQPEIEMYDGKAGRYFDMVTQVSLADGSDNIVYFSFFPEQIQRFFQTNMIHNYKIVMLHSKQKGRIEFDLNNNHRANRSDTNLHSNIDQEALYSASIANANWKLAALEQQKIPFASAWSTALWAFSLLLLLGSTALWFLRRTDSVLLTQSNALQREQRRLNHLQETTVSSEMSFHEKVRDLLVMGLDEYGMEVAILSRVDGNTYTIVTAVSPDNALQPGMSFNLANTYCRHTLKAGRPTGFEKTSTELGRDHPSYTKRSIASYVGTTVYVRGKVYGTLNFSSYHPYQGQFTQEDYRFLQLMAQWIGLEIERRESEQTSQTKNQLLESISRAQSYFISDQMQPNAMFDQILSDLLSLSYSNVGFIAEVVHDPDNKQAVDIRAMGQRYENNDELVNLFEDMLKNKNLSDGNNVLSEVIRSGAPIISNNLDDE
ncbi:MAG: GAF domain-containing protein, partial [Thioalkalispiraceae bacterium]